MKLKFIMVILAVLSINLFSVNLKPEENSGMAPKVFLDIKDWGVDVNYLKTEITFVNYVRDRQSANIHMLITRQRTGSGGMEFNLKFIGLKENKGKNAELKFYSKSTDTRDQTRKGLIKKIKQGLIPYISDTPLAEFISISYDDHGKWSSPQQTRDKWDNWAFRVGLDGNLESQDLEKAYEYRLFLSAGRVTEESKITIWGFMNNEKITYSIENEDGILEDYISETKRRMIFTSYIKSLTEHWSAGGFFNYFSSTYDNAKRYYTLGAGVEYNIFPYRDYTKRELRIQYKLEYIKRNYFETTIYDKISENLFRQRLQILLTIKETWGSMAFQLSGLNYFHDLSKNNLRTDVEIRVNVLKGVSFDINGNYSRVRDQLSLPKEEASLEEVLMQLQELATGYDLGLMVGLSFRFGSMYSNIVNPRFDVPRRHR